MRRWLDITPRSSSWAAGNEFCQRAIKYDALKDTHQTRLYIVAELEGDAAVKLGIADDPHARLEQLQRGNPRRLILLGHFAATPRLERFVHRELAEDLLDREWFRVGGHAWGAVYDVLGSLCEMAADMDWTDDLNGTRYRIESWAAV